MRILTQKSRRELIDFIQRAEEKEDVYLRTLRDSDERFEAEVFYFLYKKGGPFWELVNSRIKSIAIGGYLKSHFNAARFLMSTDRNGSWSLNIDRYFSAEQLVSLKCFEYANYGGAHPTRGIHTYNYDQTAGGKLDLREIFGWSDTALHKIKTYCELDVNRQLLCMDLDGGYSLDPWYANGTFESRWNLFSQWNVSNRGLSIALSQFSGLPFVMGVFEILIPWDFFRDKVSADYRETAIEHLIKNC
jgi:hypothetical protein